MRFRRVMVWALVIAVLAVLAVRVIGVVDYINL